MLIYPIKLLQVLIYKKYTGMEKATKVPHAVIWKSKVTAGAWLGNN